MRSVVTDHEHRAHRDTEYKRRRESEEPMIGTNRKDCYAHIENRIDERESETSRHATAKAALRNGLTNVVERRQFFG